MATILRTKLFSMMNYSPTACLSIHCGIENLNKTSNHHKLVKSERFLCGCAVEWDGKKVTVNICEFHRNETKKLKVE